MVATIVVRGMISQVFHAEQGLKERHRSGRSRRGWCSARSNPTQGRSTCAVSAFELRNQLRGRPCRVFSSDMRVRIEITSEIVLNGEPSWAFVSLSKTRPWVAVAYCALPWQHASVPEAYAEPGTSAMVTERALLRRPQAVFRPPAILSRSRMVPISIASLSRFRIHGSRGRMVARAETRNTPA